MLIAADIVATLLALATIVPFIPVSHGIVRIGDFPRQQFLVIALATALLLALFVDKGVGMLVPEAVLLAVAFLQAWHIAPFTPLWRKQSADSDGEEGCPVRLIACNVKMSNRRFDALASQIAAHDPDIVVLMEVDQKWIDGLADVLSRYPHVVAQPQDNAYGMVLASRFDLTDTEVSCLLTKRVPSIVTTVTTPGGRRFRLHAIHPEPPVPYHGADGRDGETSLVAMTVRGEDLPVLVSGDLNDVAWSGTTTRFRRISQLLDPRIGRRVFSTFDARYPPLRWPLDHLFHSAHFRFHRMKRLEACGSDHFPVLFEMLLCGHERALSRPGEASRAEVDRARELVAQARRNDEAPIGEDWEK